MNSLSIMSINSSARRSSHRYRLLKYCLVISATLTCATITLANSPSIPEDDKRFIWRIETEQNTRGTGFILSDPEIGFFLVTNKHVLTDTLTGSPFDSVRVFLNVFTEKNKVKSSDSSVFLYLRKHGKKLFVEHEDTNVDLVFVQLGTFSGNGDLFLNPSGDMKILGWKTSMVLDTRSSAINDGVIIQMIGFSHMLPQSSQFALSRFGSVASFPKESIKLNINGVMKQSQWIVVDASTRGGQSGGPAFAFPSNSNGLMLVGFSQATTTKQELSYLIPSQYILDLLERIRDMVRD